MQVTKRTNKKLILITLLSVLILLLLILFFILISKNEPSYITNDGTVGISEAKPDEDLSDNPKKHVVSENNSASNETSQTDSDTTSDNTFTENSDTNSYKNSSDISYDDSSNNSHNDVNNTDSISETAEHKTDSANTLEDNSKNNINEGEQAMEHPDRVTYRAGFYYEPLTEEIKERIYGLSYKEDCTVPYEDLRYVGVLFRNFNGETDYGEIICNKAIAQDLVEIFYELFENDYPIEKIRLVDEYNADDDLSCQDNNTSCFNYRVVAGSTNLSKHALGMAIDINPFYNPYVTYPNGVERISPPGSEPYADRDADLPYMIQKGDLCYNLFIERGFTWGGEWKTLKDYQHFQKVLE